MIRRGGTRAKRWKHRLGIRTKSRSTFLRFSSYNLWYESNSSVIHSLYPTLERGKEEPNELDLRTNDLSGKSNH
jgi:hypothetical protein